MGTTVQVEQGRWNLLGARLSTSGVGPQDGVDPFEVQLAYKKYGGFSFTTKPLNGARTTLAVDADNGDTNLDLTDSAIFPRTAGTLILDPLGAAAGPEIIDFTANDTGTGILHVPSGIQTPGAAAFPATTLVQFSYATYLRYPVSIGDTTLEVDNSVIFPPGFGKIRIYNVTHSEVVELSANVLSTGTLSLKTPLTTAFSAGDKVELVEWYEISGGPLGYYSIFFTPEELDTLEQFLYTIIRYVPGGGPLIGEFERTIDIVTATSAATEPAPTLATCVIKDHLLNLSGSPLENSGVSARLLALPALISGVGVYDEIVSTKTDANGFFQLTLIQGATVDIVIPATGYRRTIVVPSATSANLFEI